MPMLGNLAVPSLTIYLPTSPAALRTTNITPISDAFTAPIGGTSSPSDARSPRCHVYSRDLAPAPAAPPADVPATAPATPAAAAAAPSEVQEVGGGRRWRQSTSRPSSGSRRRTVRSFVSSPKAAAAAAVAASCAAYRSASRRSASVGSPALRPRRPKLSARDLIAVAVLRAACPSNLPGYHFSLLPPPPPPLPPPMPLTPLSPLMLSRRELTSSSAVTICCAVTW